MRQCAHFDGRRGALSLTNTNLMVALRTLFASFSISGLRGGISAEKRRRAYCMTRGKSAASPKRSEELAHVALDNLPLRNGMALGAKTDGECCAG